MKRCLELFVVLSLAANPTSGASEEVPAAGAMRCTTVAWIEHDKPLVRATINGREFTFVVDSGAEHDGWITPELARELGLPIVGSVPADGDDPTGGLPFYGVASFKLGSIVFSDIRFGELPPFGPNPPPFDGIIGNGLFSDMQVVLDYKRGLLQVTDHTLESGHVVPFDQYGIPVLTLFVGEQPIVVHLDTGNLASKLYVTSADFAELEIIGEPVQSGRAMTVSGAFDVMQATLAQPVRFGATTLPITTIRWPGAYGEGQLGSAGLSGQTVRIDWPNRRVSILPEEVAPACP